MGAADTDGKRDSTPEEIADTDGWDGGTGDGASKIEGTALSRDLGTELVVRRALALGTEDGADEGLGLRVGSTVVRRAAVRTRTPAPAPRPRARAATRRSARSSDASSQQCPFLPLPSVAATERRRGSWLFCRRGWFRWHHAFYRCVRHLGSRGGRGGSTSHRHVIRTAAGASSSPLSVASWISCGWVR